MKFFSFLCVEFSCLPLHSLFDIPLKKFLKDPFENVEGKKWLLNCTLKVAAFLTSVYHKEWSFQVHVHVIGKKLFY